LKLQIIGHIYNDFGGKFGVPRQSGLVEEIISRVVLLPEFLRAEAFRGLTGFSHVWLLWLFSEGFASDEAGEREWQPTVRPPRLGGNQRVGVFASRSPYRPNVIGLSCVRLERIEITEKFGPVLYVAGVDLLDKTPIYDIKPYIPMSDCHPEALEGYTKETRQHRLSVDFQKELLALFPEEKQRAILGILAEDPRPAYVQDEDRIYGVSFGGYNVKFRIAGETAHVCKVENAAGDSYNLESFHKI